MKPKTIKSKSKSKSKSNTRRKNKNNNKKTGRGVPTSLGAAYGVKTVAPLSSPIHVKHSEYIYPISINTTEEKAKIYDITLETFSWLNGIKEKYTEFSIEFLRLTYVTTIGSQEKGNVAMALNYLIGTSDRKLGYAEVSLIDGAVTGPVWGTQSLVFDKTAQILKKKFVIPPKDSGNQWNALGKFIVATTAGTAPGVVGWVRADYEVTFTKPLATQLPVDQLEIKIPASTVENPTSNAEILTDTKKSLSLIDQQVTSTMLLTEASAKDIIGINVEHPGRYNLKSQLLRHTILPTADYMNGNMAVFVGNKHKGTWTEVTGIGTYDDGAFTVEDNTSGKLETTGDTVGLLDVTLNLFKCPCSIGLFLNRASKFASVAAKTFLKVTSLSPASFIPPGEDLGSVYPDTSMMFTLTNIIQTNISLARAKALKEAEEKLIEKELL